MWGRSVFLAYGQNIGTLTDSSFIFQRLAILLAQNFITFRIKCRANTSYSAVTFDLLTLTGFFGGPITFDKTDFTSLPLKRLESSLDPNFCFRITHHSWARVRVGSGWSRLETLSSKPSPGSKWKPVRCLHRQGPAAGVGSGPATSLGNFEPKKVTSRPLQVGSS